MLDLYTGNVFDLVQVRRWCEARTLDNAVKFLAELRR